MLMYMFVAVSHIRLRREAERENPGKLKVKMWLFPYLTYATLLMIVTIFVSQAFIADMRMQFYLTILAAVVVIATYFLRVRNKQEFPILKGSEIGLEKD